MAQIWLKFGWLFSFLAGLVFPPALIALLWFVDVLPFGTSLVLPFGASHLAMLGEPLLAGLAVSIGAGALLVLITLLRWITRRRGAREFAGSLLFCAGVVVALHPALIAGHGGKQLIARHLANRGDRVVDAIERYINEKNHPPQNLSDLVPDYVPAMPTTGSSRYPDFVYRVGRDAAWGNPWSLEIEMFEIFKWDVLYFCPKQDCMEMSGGGTIQMGRWVFLDE